ncbi:retrotransposable element tf2 protein type 2 [Lasius niger]|uniref:Retrotransposable element tf2 protein type 2 n=1 Tax=Lasius niger TaxID=67767 RepID=A0A0J7KBT2_LASNI|nr:retrotransposable element tf2 protein type 2 [Lasius niger]
MGKIRGLGCSNFVGNVVGWERIRERLPLRYKWKVQLAKRKNKKGRACGGMLLGIRKDVLIEEKGSREEEEGRLECTVKIGEIRWRIVGVYVNGDMGKKLEGLKE